MVGMGYGLNALLPLDPLTFYKLHDCAIARKKSNSASELHTATMAAQGDIKKIQRMIDDYGR